ncbi:HD-GYP domain-containing protein [Elusimicrobiota bacterium]
MQNNASEKLRLLIALHRKSMLAASHDALMETICIGIQEILEAERATLFLLDSGKRELYGRIATGLSREGMDALRFPITDGIAGRVVREGCSMNVPDAYQHPNFKKEHDAATNFITRSLLAVPIKNSNNSTIGVLEVFNKSSNRHFTDDDEGLLALFANQIGSTLEILKLVEELKFTGIEAIYALAQTAEHRDSEDAPPHIKRVGKYSIAFAKLISLPPQMVEDIGITSQLHDIGKVAIPDAILKKPGKLTPDEWLIMERHTVYGYEMLMNLRSPLFQIASRIALSHHEKFDGTGYPNKLKGEEIPLEARMVNIVDSFDTMTSKRIYKSAMAFEEAVEEVLRCSGKQFDPELTRVFTDNQDHFKEIFRTSHSL